MSDPLVDTETAPDAPRPTGKVVVILLAAAVAVVAIGLITAPPRPEDRTKIIAAQLRCPVCQSESVLDSPSDTARQMRELIASQVAEGRTDQEIIDYFVARYGTWILLDPPASPRTIPLLVAPAVILLLGLWLIRGRLRPRRRRPAVPPS